MPSMYSAADRSRICRHSPDTSGTTALATSEVRRSVHPDKSRYPHWRQPIGWSAIKRFNPCHMDRDPIQPAGTHGTALAPVRPRSVRYRHIPFRCGSVVDQCPRLDRRTALRNCPDFSLGHGTRNESDRRNLCSPGALRRRFTARRIAPYWRPCCWTGRNGLDRHDRSKHGFRPVPRTVCTAGADALTAP